jgi:hypothetical protein
MREPGRWQADLAENSLAARKIFYDVLRIETAVDFFPTALARSQNIGYNKRAGTNQGVTRARPA